MKKLLLAALPVLMILAAMPILAAVVITMSTQAAAECRTTSDLTVASDLGDLGEIAGPVGGPVTGSVGVAQANIPDRSGPDGFRASMPKVLSHDPDFVTLNEMSGRSLAEIEGAAPGYEAFREATTTGDANSMATVVLWKRESWTKVNGGRIQIVDDDQLYFKGEPRTWDRFATWVMLQRKSDGAVVSLVGTHHMTNPHKFPRQHGSPALTRAQQYGAGMDILLQLTNSLASHGPVLIGGDMNTHASYADLPWSAAAEMKAAGYGWADHGVDFIFFPQSQGVQLAGSWTGPMVSDHQWVAARLNMNGAGPSHTSTPVTDPQVATITDSTAAGGDVAAALMGLRFSEGYPALTREQARNAISIAQVARDLRVPRFGLQVAIATAIQESKLVNLDHGDRDSLGLFQQRPSTGWGSRAQVTNPTLATQAFFGRAQHTSNPGLLDIPGWEQMPLTQAAQAVQRSGFADAYAQWEDVAGDITDLLGGDLPDIPVDAVATASTTDCGDGETINPVTLATLNLLGAGHTDGQAGGGKEHAGFADWETRLPGAMRSIDDAGVTVAALQEVHGPQADALASRYSSQWGMYPSTGPTQNKVIWDLNEWTATDQRLVDVPYFDGKNVGMPLVQLTSTTTGQTIWVWSIHNPADAHGNAAKHRAEALRRQLDTLADLAATGTPAVIMGDFNDGRDGQGASHCVLTPTATNAFGGSVDPCRKPAQDAPIDHVYGANLSWAGARVDRSTQSNKISDHPLVIATTAGSTAGCAVEQTSYNLGEVKPELIQLVNVLGPMFDIGTVGGYRESAADPGGHPAGLAADFMVALTTAGRAQGDALAAYAKEHSAELGVDYIIWYQRIWSTDRAGEGWRPMGSRGGDTEDHRDHVHINVKPGGGTQGGTTPVSGSDASASCSEIVYPVPTAYVANDAHNWHSQGSAWESWHTGTDFSAPCGTPVYAAHAGTIEIDTTQSWAGPMLVKVSSGTDSLTTWYAHMENVTVSRGETVQAGQQIGMVGDEGNSRGCHLHFEVHLENGSIYGPDNVDPSQWLAESVSSSTARAA